MPGPLDGIRILDFCILQNGGYATMMLADMGAEVIKIEDPVKGDPARAIIGRGRAAELGVAPYFEGQNRNKRSMTLDLKKEKGRQVFYRLVEKADVVSTNLRVHVPRELGFDYESLVKYNPKIILAHSTGYGKRGPDAGDGVYDILGLARSGAMLGLTMPGDSLHYLGSIGLADQVGAMMLAHAIVLALFARERRGIGQEVDVSQLGSAIMMQNLALYFYTFQGTANPRPRREEAGNPLFSFYKAQDGRWFALGCVQSDRYWHNGCEVLGLQHLEKDPKFVNHQARERNAREMVNILDNVFATRPATEWVRLLKSRGLLATEVQDYAGVLQDPQVLENDYLIDFDHPVMGKVKVPGVPIQLSATPGAVQTAAPQFGQHTHEVLLEAGYTWDDIAALQGEGVI